MPTPTNQDVSDAKRYLNTYRIPKEQRGVIEPNVTGMSRVANGIGSFHIPEEDYETFLDNIASCIFQKKVPLGLVEKPYTDETGQVYTPMKIDLDFRFPYEPAYLDDDKQPIRQYTQEIIQAFIQAVFEETAMISSFEEYTKEDITFYVLRKPAPELEQKKGDTEPRYIKDGIHIVAKDLMIVPLIQLYIRKQVVKRMNDIFPASFFEKTTRGDIYDESVICRTGWMIHGACKEGKHPYRLWFRQVYAPPPVGGELSEPTIIKNTGRARMDDRKLVKTLSIRFGITDMGIVPLESAIPLLQKFFETNRAARNSARLGGASNPTTVTRDSPGMYDSITSVLTFPEDALNSERIASLRTAAWLVDMLDSRRSDAYDTWIRVGICLRNMGRIEGLPDVRKGTAVEEMEDKHKIIVDNGMYNLWIAFSRKSPRYVEGSEDKEDWYHKHWQGFNATGSSESLLKRPSLRLWARHDSPERYKVFLQKDERAEINRVIAGGGTHVDIASLARLIYGDTFICAHIKLNEWYEYKQSCHRFVQSDSATTLRAKLSGEIRGKFGMRMRQLINELTPKPDTESSEDSAAITTKSAKSPLDDERVKTVGRIIKSLATTKFLNDVIVECKHKFYETYRDEFFKKIDSNVNLIGFTNGVLDLGTCTFRPGRPDDMISKTTGYDYVEYDEDDDRIERVYSIFEKIYTNPRVREYMWAIMSTNLKGENWLQQIYFLQGEGANGKSLLTKWLSKVFGDYAIKSNVTLLTDKRGPSQSASPETARLKGSRFVYMEEPDESKGSEINHSLLKEMTGDNNLAGRPLYKDIMEFPVTFKIWFACNGFPKITSEDATWRRLRVIEHPSKFIPRGREILDPEREFHQDVRLMSDDYVKEYRSAMMAILVHYYTRYWRVPDGIGYQSAGFKEPEEVLTYSSQVRVSNDRVAPFFEKESKMFVVVEQDDYLRNYKPNPSKARRDLLDVAAISKVIKDSAKVTYDPRHGRGRSRNSGSNIGSINKLDIKNYIENIRGIRKVRIPGDSRKWYYLVRKYTDADEIDDDIEETEAAFVTEEEFSMQAAAT